MCSGDIFKIHKINLMNDSPNKIQAIIYSANRPTINHIRSNSHEATLLASANTFASNHLQRYPKTSKEGKLAIKPLQFSQ